MFQFNKERALSLFKEEIRAKREEKFAELDIQFMRAVESGDTTKQTEIATQKQTLRDLTNISLDSFNTQSEMIALWPTSFLGECPFR